MRRKHGFEAAGQQK